MIVDTKLTCLSQINHGRWCQETYETASKQARRRANLLRRLGYLVSVSSMGPQVTWLGVIKLTLVDIRPGSNLDTSNLPEINKNGFTQPALGSYSRPMEILGLPVK